MKFNLYGKCPECGINWDDGDIFEALVKQPWRRIFKDKNGQIKYKNEKELKKYIKELYAPPYRFSRLIDIRDSEICDGVYRWQCPDCKTEWDRRTEEKIKQ